MKTLRILFAFLCLALVAQAQQRVPRTVPTVTDMLALDPASLATKTVGTNTSFEAVCITLGDTVAGVPGSRLWRYQSTATNATNVISQGGPLAGVWGASAGRWTFAPQVGTVTNSADFRATNELAAFGPGGSLGGSGLPFSKVPYLTNLTGDVQAAINALTIGKFGVSSNAVTGELLIATATNAAASSGVTLGFLSNLPRAVPTVVDLMAVSPTNFQAGLATNALVYVETSGDTVAGDGRKTWLWNAASAAATNAASSGGPIAFPYGSASGRWIRVAESPTGNDELVLDSMASLVSLAQGGNLPGIVFLREYYAGSTNQGAGRWYLDKSSTIGTNLAIIATPWGSSTGRYLPHFAADEIDPRRLGARTGFVVQAELEQAIAMADSGLWPRMVKIPAGIWKTTNTLTLNNGTNNSHLVGVGRARTVNSTFTGGSLIEQQSDNTPVLSIGGQNGVIRDLSLMSKNYQASSATNSAGIKFLTGVDSLMWRIDNIGIEKVGYLIYVPADGAGFVNNWIGHLHGLSFSVQGVYLGRSGTMNYFPWWYIQNFLGAVPIETVVTNVVKSGAQLTLQTTGVNNGATTNSLIQLVEFESAFNKQIAIKSVSGNDVVVEFPSDPGTMTDLVGRFFFFPQPITGSAVFIQSELEIDANAWDIEHIQAPNGVMIENYSQSLRISNLHFENIYSTTGPMKAIWNRGGSIQIAMLGAVNFGAITAGPNCLFYNDTGGGTVGSFRVESMWMRDFATQNQTSQLAIAAATAPRVYIGSANPRNSIRANTVSRIAWGDAVTDTLNYGGDWVDNWATSTPLYVKMNGSDVMRLVSTNNLQFGLVGNTNGVAAMELKWGQLQSTMRTDTPYQTDVYAQNAPNTGNTYSIQAASGTPGTVALGNGTTGGTGVRVGGSANAKISRTHMGSVTLTNGSAFVSYTDARAGSYIVVTHSLSATNANMGTLVGFPTASSGITIKSSSPTDSNPVNFFILTP